MNARTPLIATLVLVLGLPTAVSAAIRYHAAEALDQGQIAGHPMTLSGGDRYWIQVVASHQNVDFDLTIRDEEGHEVAQSNDPPLDEEHLVFCPPETGLYVVEVLAYNSAGWYELIVLNLDGN